MASAEVTAEEGGAGKGTAEAGAGAGGIVAAAAAAAVLEVAGTGGRAEAGGEGRQEIRIRGNAVGIEEITRRGKNTRRCLQKRGARCTPMCVLYTRDVDMVDKQERELDSFSTGGCLWGFSLTLSDCFEDGTYIFFIPQQGGTRLKE